jgi:hypothetical protein
MIATANEAVQALRHRRTGEVLATKKLARNTRLVYYADELVGLKLHDTIIAMYKPNGVTIDLRGPGSPNGEGWFTNVTLDRIASFTPARVERAGGITWLVDPSLPGGILPYAHGTHVNPNGSCELPIDTALLGAVARIVETYPQKLRRHADKIMRHWSNWEQVESCCTGRGEQSEWEHHLDHFERGEVVIPPSFGVFMRSPTSNGNAYGDDLVNHGRRELLTDLKQLTQLAVKRVAPDFPYPQLTRTKEGRR